MLLILFVIRKMEKIISNKGFFELLRRNEVEENRSKISLFNTIIQELELSDLFEKRNNRILANKFLSNTVLAKFKKDFEGGMSELEENGIISKIKEDLKLYCDKTIKKILPDKSSNR